MKLREWAKLQPYDLSEACLCDVTEKHFLYGWEQQGKWRVCKTCGKPHRNDLNTCEVCGRFFKGIRPNLPFAIPCPDCE